MSQRGSDVGVENNSAPGAHLLSWDRHGNPNQCFDVQFLGAPQPAPAPAPAPRYDIHVLTSTLNRLKTAQPPPGRYRGFYCKSHFMPTW